MSNSAEISLILIVFTCVLIASVSQHIDSTRKDHEITKLKAQLEVYKCLKP